MDRRVWIGETLSPLPEGWYVFSSIDDFAASGQNADQIIVNDPAALLREADWLVLFAADPLARIVRRIGPWRASCERTDPQWPGVVTVVCESVEELLQQLELEQLPYTAGYDERAACVSEVDLEGLSAVVQIGDAAMKAMWEETLLASGATLTPSPSPGGRGEQSTLCVTDEETANKCGWIIRLAPDPWNLGDGHSSCESRTLTPGPSPEGRGEEEMMRNVIVASVLDSPTTVLARLVTLRTSGSPLPPGEGLGVRVPEQRHRSLSEREPGR